MFSRYSSKGGPFSHDEDVVGIVVHSGREGEPREPRAVAFVWGGEVLPAPSLPFGRWKAAAHAA